MLLKTKRSSHSYLKFNPETPCINLWDYFINTLEKWGLLYRDTTHNVDDKTLQIHNYLHALKLNTNLHIFQNPQDMIKTS